MNHPTFDIQTAGARPDGRTSSTAAIQRAIDDCQAAGGGRVHCGPGEYRIGTLHLKSRVELYLASGCRLVGSPDLADYRAFAAPGFRAEAAPEGNALGLILADRVEDAAITGPGEINGSGPAFYDTSTRQWGRFYQKPSTPRPRLLIAYQCRNLRLEEAAFNDSPCWTFWLMQCEGVAIRRIRMLADQKMINNDGIDLDMCRDVTISDSQFRTGDDCIILRAMRPVFETERPCENIVVTNCLLDSGCQGIRVGCPSDGTIRNATFSNLIINSQHNGIIFEFPQRYLAAGCRGAADIRHVVFTQVVIECRGIPIGLIAEEGVALPHLGEIDFSHFRIRSGRPMIVQGNPETVIQNVTFSDIAIETEGEDAMVCRWARGIQLNRVTLANRR